MFKNKRILITGGTGFIGKHLVNYLLDQGAWIFLLTRRPNKTSDHVTYIQCDLTDLTDLEATKMISKMGHVDYIVYMAANIPPLSKKKETMHEAKINTLDPFVRFLEFFGRLGNKIIYTSTIDIYGYPGKSEYDEKQEPAPATPYAIAKYASEEYLKYFSRVQSIPYTIVRFSQVYGPNEPLVRVIPFIVDAAVRKKSFQLWGRGLDKRRYLFVKDAVQGIYKAMLKGSNDVYHIAGKETSTILDVIKTVKKIAGKPLIVDQKFPDRTDLHTLPSIKKAQKELRFKPEYTLEKGLKTVLHTKV